MRWIVALAAVLTASALVWQGAPRLVASVLKAPAQAALTQADAGRTPPRDQLKRAIRHLERARRWEDSARLASEIGFLHLLDAFQMDASDEGRAATASLAADSLRQSLGLSPARPHPWVRSAYAEDLETGRGDEVARLLGQSTTVGAFVGEVALVRLKLLLEYWDDLPPDQRIYAFKQVRYIWGHNPDFIFQAARQAPSPHIIRFALRPVPGAVDRFDRVVPPPAD